MRAFQLFQPQRKHKIAINFIAAKKKIFFCGECLFSERMLNVSCVQWKKTLSRSRKPQTIWIRSTFSIRQKQLFKFRYSKKCSYCLPYSYTSDLASDLRTSNSLLLTECEFFRVIFVENCESEFLLITSQRFADILAKSFAKDRASLTSSTLSRYNLHECFSILQCSF